MLNMSIILFVFGILVFGAYRIRAKKNVIMQRTLAKNIREIEVNDDVWLSGIIQTENPLTAPYFKYETVYYNYRRIPVKHQNTVNPESKIYNETRSLKCEINDRTGVIQVDLGKSEKSEIYSEEKNDGQYIHQIEYIPARGLLSAVGIVGPNKSELISKGEVELLVTPQGYKQYLLKTKQGLQAHRLSGLSLLWVGFIMTVFQLLPMTEHHSVQTASSLIIGFCLPIYLYLHSRIVDRLIHLRGQVYSVWSQLDEGLVKRRRTSRKILQQIIETNQYDESQLADLKQTLTLIESIQLEKRYLPRIQKENDLTERLKNLNLGVNSNLRPQLQLVGSDGKHITNAQSEKSDLLNQFTEVQKSIDEKSLEYLDVAKIYNNYIRSWFVESIAQKLFFEPILYFGEFKANQELLDYMKTIPQRKNDQRIQTENTTNQQQQILRFTKNKKVS